MITVVLPTTLSVIAAIANIVHNQWIVGHEGR